MKINLFSVLMLISIITLLPLQSAFAGEVFKRKCPYSCSSLGISKSQCKDWKEGDKCVVEVASGARGSGSTTLKRKCPLSCNSMGIPKNRCKDWKEGNKCVVQF